MKGDFNFEPKNKNSMSNHQYFDDLKAHMLNETIKVIERKVNTQREILAKLQSD